MWRFSALIFLTLGYINNPVAAQSVDLQQRNRQFDSITHYQQWVSDVPGYAVAVVSSDHIIYEKSLGVLSNKSGKPVNRLSDFHMASVSKPFVAMAILKLCDKRALHLDSTLVSYLPEFKMKDKRYAGITLCHILTHSSGIPDVLDYEWERPEFDDQSAIRYAQSFAENNLDFEPGTDFRYSNAAFDLLAPVIQRVTGQTFENYIKKEVLQFADMNNSSFLLEDITKRNFTLPHQLDSNLALSPLRIYPYNRKHAPSSTLHSNLKDLVKWAQLLLKNGEQNYTSILKKETWSEMIIPKMVVTDRYKVCLSWFQTEIEGRIVYFHSGGDIGYRTFVGFCPSENVAVVLMGNNDLFDGAEAGFIYFQTFFSGKIPPLTLKPAQLEWRKHVLQGGLQKVKKVYEDMRSENVQRFNTSGSAILELGSMLFTHGHRKYATDVLLWGAELYPQDGSWYGHLGDIYAVWNQIDEAKLYYQKAVSIMSGEKRELIEAKLKTLDNSVIK